MRGNTIGDLIGALIVIALYVGIPVTLVAAWITHVVVCIQDQNWLFLIAGAVAAPVAVVHGIGAWFGAW